MTIQSDFKWFILHSSAGSEKKVAREINEQSQRLGLHHLIKEIFVPTEKVMEIKKGKRKEVDKKLFPGYMLLNIVQDDRLSHMIRNIPKVVGFLGRISETEVSKIISKIEEDSSLHEKVQLYEIGESVKIIDGAFDSFVGLVEDVDEEKKLVKLSVSIFGRSTTIELQFDQIIKTK